MSSQNYFDLLGDDENEEPTTVIARATLPSPVEKLIAQKSHQSATAPTRSATKPPPDMVREEKSFEGGRGARVGLRQGRGSRSAFSDRDAGSREHGLQRDNREGIIRERGYHNDRNLAINRESNDGSSYGHRGGNYSSSDVSLLTGGTVSGVGHVDTVSRAEGENWSSDGSRGRGRGNRGRYRVLVGDTEERPRRREFDRRSGSGFGNELKRDGSGRGNWGAEVEQRSQQEVVESIPKDEGEKGFVEEDKSTEGENHAAAGVPADSVVEEKGGEEDNELTLDEYEKILEGKRKALSVSKAEERRVQADKEFESMQLVEKKVDDDVFIKLGSEREKKKKEKEALEKDEKAKKTQNINEFLKPADGEKLYASSGSRGRGRSRGRGSEGRGVGDGERNAGFGVRGNVGPGSSNARRISAPRIEDPGQFPTLGSK